MKEIFKKIGKAVLGILKSVFIRKKECCKQ
jgi:hypothetical protein